MPRLSEEEIERFVEEGALLLPGCFSAQDALPLVHGTLDLRTPPPRLGRHRDAPIDLDPADLDLRDASTWQGRHRLDVQTGRSLPIETFAPRLWGAIQSLLPGHRVTRRTMGEMWILKGKSPEQTRPPVVDAEYLARFGWHIDTPGPHTTFEGRRDALVLLVLWSDVGPGGGGSLYSGQSLDHVVRALEEHEEGVDTRDREWARSVVRRCSDARELTGRVGDVLITHPFALHAGQNNYADALRILENPTITVAEPLCYHSDHRSPSPVERAVIRRLSRPRPRPRDLEAEASRYLVDRHPEYFLPGRVAFSAQGDEAERARVHALDAALTRRWASRLAARLAEDHKSPLSRAEAAVAEVRGLLVNQRTVQGELRESAHDEDFARTAYARLLRGFVNCEGQNHLLGLVLTAFVDEVYLFDAIDPATGRSPHALLYVRHEGGWFFADAWGKHALFHVATRTEPPYPGTPELAELAREGEDGGLLARACYEQGALLSPALRLPEASLEAAVAALPARALAAPPPDSTWQAFLRVRAQHARRGAEGAAEAYTALAKQHRLGGATRALVDALLERARRAP